MITLKKGTGMTSKNKLIAVSAVFLVFALFMYFFGYGIMAKKNQQIADSISQSNVELEVLRREQKSFEQGKIDLAELVKSDYPPDELFSKDTKLVKEIQQLEAAAQRYGLDMEIRVSGSQKDAKAVANTNDTLYAVPYTITLEGTPDSILLFEQSFERMPFVTILKSMFINVAKEDKTSATISAEFYIKK